jgi:tetrahydromethanopterin S-methyltransferase subunit H
MFSFTKKQEILEIGELHCGGQPGHLPTVLFGGLFFKGEPQFERATHLLNTMFHLSIQTGLPAVPDFFIRKEEFVEPIITFIETTLPPKQPFSVDITDPHVKVHVLELLKDKHLLSKTIYNSLHIGVTEAERDALKHATPHAAIIVAFNPKDPSPDGKIEILENSAHLLDKGLLDIAKEVGVNNLFIDTAAQAPGNNSGAAIAALPVIKEEYGLPTGCAIHNVVEKSSWLQQFSPMRSTVDAASNVNISLFGGDFAIFGPMANAERVFPIIAWQDILISEYAEQYFGIASVDHHPRRLLSK